jgi:hypothetical protein
MKIFKGLVASIVLFIGFSNVANATLAEDLFDVLVDVAKTSGLEEAGVGENKEAYETVISSLTSKFISELTTILMEKVIKDSSIGISRSALIYKLNSKITQLYGKSTVGKLSPLKKYGLDLFVGVLVDASADVVHEILGGDSSHTANYTSLAIKELRVLWAAKKGLHYAVLEQALVSGEQVYKLVEKHQELMKAWDDQYYSQAMTNANKVALGMLQKYKTSRPELKLLIEAEMATKIKEAFIVPKNLFGTKKISGGEEYARWKIAKFRNLDKKKYKGIDYLKQRIKDNQTKALTYANHAKAHIERNFYNNGKLDSTNEVERYKAEIDRFYEWVISDKSEDEKSYTVTPITDNSTNVEKITASLIERAEIERVENMGLANVLFDLYIQNYKTPNDSRIEYQIMLREASLNKSGLRFKELRSKVQEYDPNYKYLYDNVWTVKRRAEQKIAELKEDLESSKQATIEELRIKEDLLIRTLGVVIPLQRENKAAALINARITSLAESLYVEKDYLRLNAQSMLDSVQKQIVNLGYTATPYNFNIIGNEDDINNDIDNDNDTVNRPFAQITPVYIDNKNQIKVSWSVKNTNILKVEYSFDDKNWQQAFEIDIQNYNGSSKQLSIGGLSSNNTIYFRNKAKTNNLMTTSNSYKLVYKSSNNDSIDNDNSNDNIGDFYVTWDNLLQENGKNIAKIKTRYQGKVQSREVNTRIFISYDTSCTTADTQLGNTVSSQLGGIGINDNLISFKSEEIDIGNISDNYKTGTKYLCAIIDYDNQYKEASESNNSSYITLNDGYYGNNAPDKASTNLSASYNDSTNKFNISWSSKNTNQKHTFYYSYDNNNWTKITAYRAVKGSEEIIELQNSLDYTKIYFKSSVSSDNGVVYGYTNLEYTPKTGLNTTKPIFKQLSSITKTTNGSIDLEWSNTSSNHYQIEYADNTGFYGDYNKAEIIHYTNTTTISNLVNNKIYYFRVRNSNGNGSYGLWSDIISTTIEIESVPVINTSIQTPNNNAVGIDKRPKFSWDIKDEDGDELEYYVSIGTSIDDLNLTSGWINDTQFFNYGTAFDRDLKPNTKYYWQVKYREKSKLKENYGGSYPTSPVWNFTTVSSGPDLAITNITRLGDVKIDEWISYEITIKNIGSEIADKVDIKPYFYKNNNEIEFASFKYGSLDNKLNSGDEEKVVVKLRFESNVIVKNIPKYSGGYETKTYDNVLVDGNNIIRFKLNYNKFDVDTNSGNDVKDEIINYSLASNLPNIEEFEIVTNNLSDKKGDIRYIQGWDVIYRLVAEDSSNIHKVEIDYRLSKDSPWVNFKTFNNINTTRFCINNCGEPQQNWSIPENGNYATNSAQLRVKVYNSPNTFSTAFSKEFKIFSNSVAINNITIAGDIHEIGNTLKFSYDIDSVEKLDYMKVYLKTSNGYSKQMLDYTRENTSSLELQSNLSFTLPDYWNKSKIVSKNAYLYIYAEDKNGAVARKDSRMFEIIEKSNSVTTPTVITNTQTHITYDDNFNLSWQIEEQNIDKFEIYKIVNNSQQLLQTINDASIRNYEYKQDNNTDDAIILKLRTYKSNNDISDSYHILKVLGKAELSNFTANTSQISLGDSIDFSWQVSGANSNNISTGYRKCDNDIDWVEIFSTKNNSKKYTADNFTGNCQFGISSNISSIKLENQILVKGNLYHFNTHSFLPKNEYYQSNKVVRFNWNDWSDDLLKYDFFIKKSTDSDFVKIATTSDKYYEYEHYFQDDFDWKVSFEYNGKVIESESVKVNVKSLSPTDISKLDIVFIDNKPNVSVEYSSVKDATRYDIYRAFGDGYFYNIGNSTHTSYIDTSVIYGNEYKYYIIATNGTNISISSKSKSINVYENNIANVIIENENFKSLEANEINLKYHLDSSVDYEFYEVLLGDTIDNLTTYKKTQDRELLIDNLEYGRNYYVEIYALNYNGDRVSIPAKLQFTTGFDNKNIADKTVIETIQLVDNGIYLSWSEVSNVSLYAIYRKENNGKYQYINSVKNNEYTDNFNLISGNSYQYVIATFNSNGYTLSNSSNAIAIGTKNNQNIEIIYINKGINLISGNINMENHLNDDIGIVWAVVDKQFVGYAPNPNTNNLISSYGFKNLEQSYDHEALIVHAKDDTTIKSYDSSVVLDNPRVAPSKYTKGLGYYGTSDYLNISDMKCYDDSSVDGVIKFANGKKLQYIATQNDNDFYDISPNQGFITWCK